MKGYRLEKAAKRGPEDRLFEVPEWQYVGRVYVFAESEDEALRRYRKGAGFAGEEGDSDELWAPAAYECLEALEEFERLAIEEDRHRAAPAAKGGGA
jgi:hypothetical protein